MAEGGFDEYTDTETITVSSGSFRDRIDVGPNGNFPTWGICAAILTNVKLLNVTDQEVVDMYTKLINIPTGVFGVIFEEATENFPRKHMANVEVIVVNIANHTDVKRTTTNTEGVYFIRVEPGGYLIQAIGGGPSAYEYIDIERHELKKIWLKYN